MTLTIRDGNPDDYRAAFADDIDTNEDDPENDPATVWLNSYEFDTTRAIAVNPDAVWLAECGEDVENDRNSAFLYINRVLHHGKSFSGDLYAPASDPDEGAEFMAAVAAYNAPKGIPVSHDPTATNPVEYAIDGDALTCTRCGGDAEDTLIEIDISARQNTVGGYSTANGTLDWCTGDGTYEHDGYECRNCGPATLPVLATGAEWNEDWS